MMFMGIFLLFSEFLSRKGSLIRPGRGFFWFSNALFCHPKNFFCRFKNLELGKD
jgi:hypothetical protein